MTKKFLGIVLMFGLIISLAGCSLIQEKLKDEPPELRLKIDGQVFTALTGTYSWDKVEADSVIPSEMVELQKEDILVKTGTEIELDFELEPNEFQVEIWEGTGKSLYENESGIIIVNEDRRFIVYGVYAEWSLGSVQYAFLVVNEDFE